MLLVLSVQLSILNLALNYSLALVIILNFLYQAQVMVLPLFALETLLLTLVVSLVLVALQHLIYLVLVQSTFNTKDKSWHIESL